MSGTSRESTSQERILDNIFHSLRSLDKITWYSVGDISLRAADMIEDAQYIITQLNRFIDEIHYQASRKDSKETQ